ncbi:MAG: hypothetical protein EOO93_28415 [Pedobacter sp.]|nr:MAG: hypothetical protein EOO93_28415 [Pedobacter sp.]
MLLFLIFFVLPLPLLIWFFIRSKTRKAKWFIGVAMVLFTAFLVYMAIGLWAMDVEDLYGDKQEIYWQGSSGDTIKLIDYNTKEHLTTGILKKTWHRIHVQSNGKELDIFNWIEKETGEYYIETSQEFKDNVITVAVWCGKDQAHFIGAYNDPYVLDVNFMASNFLKYKLTTFEVNGQMPIAEQGLAKFQHAKKDTLIYKDSVDGNNLTISVWGEKGIRKAKIFRKGDDKKAHFYALDYDKFREK